MSLRSGLPVLGMIICTASFAQPVATAITAAESDAAAQSVLNFTVPVDVAGYPANRQLVKDAVAPEPPKWPGKRDSSGYDYKSADSSLADRYEAYKKSSGNSTAEFVSSQHLLDRQRLGRPPAKKIEAPSQP